MVYFSLFTISFLAATILPASSEITLASLFLTNNFNALGLFLSASFGNILGSVFNWFLGFYLLFYTSKSWFPFNQIQIDKASKWFKKFGCHHCGSSKGKVIGDHMPPNKTAFGSGARAAANRGASTTRRVFNFIRGVPLQRFYPQCESCSALQSIAVRTGATKLVSHAVGVRYAVFAGAAVGVSTLHFGTIKTWVDDKVKRINGVVRA